MCFRHRRVGSRRELLRLQYVSAGRQAVRLPGWDSVTRGLLRAGGQAVSLSRWYAELRRLAQAGSAAPLPERGRGILGRLSGICCAWGRPVLGGWSGGGGAGAT